MSIDALLGLMALPDGALESQRNTQRQQFEKSVEQLREYYAKKFTESGTHFTEQAAQAKEALATLQEKVRVQQKNCNELKALDAETKRSIDSLLEQISTKEQEVADADQKVRDLEQKKATPIHIPKGVTPAERAGQQLAERSSTYVHHQRNTGAIQ